MYRGWVEKEEYHRLLHNALCFIHPSSFESLGIALLEAFAAGVPGLVSKASRVLVDHCRASNGGLWFEGYDEFEVTLKMLVEEPELRRVLGRNGRNYVTGRFSLKALRRRLQELFPPTAALPDPS